LSTDTEIDNSGHRAPHSAQMARASRSATSKPAPIDRDGEDAQLYAAAKTVVLAGEGDEEGAAIWRQIAAAVEELQRARRPHEAVN